MLAHTVTGDGPSVVVLLHGFLGSGRNVASLARALVARNAGLRAVALDLPGHGASPPIAAGADLPALASAVLATVRKLDVPLPLRVVGHSLGGRVALAACRLEPTAVAHVVLLDITPSPVLEARDTDHVLAALLEAPASVDRREAMRAHLVAAGLGGTVTDWLLLNLVRDGGTYRWRIDRGALAALHHRTSREDLWDAIERARPYTVHAILGAESTYVTPTDANRLVMAGCPVETVAGTDHWLHVERTDDVADRIRARMP